MPTRRSKREQKKTDHVGVFVTGRETKLSAGGQAAQDAAQQKIQHGEEKVENRKTM